MTIDSKRSIIKSFLTFLSGTFLSRISGFFRDVCMAYTFGTTPSVAALLVAFRWSHLFRRILGEGAMQAAFIPLFESLKAQDKHQAEQFFCDLKVSLSYTLLLLMTFFGGLLCFAWHKWPEDEVWLLTLLCLPGLFFICHFGINNAKMQCEKRYFLGSAAPILFNLMWILGVLVTQSWKAPQAMMTLAFFISLGCALEWLITFPFTQQMQIKATPFSKTVLKMIRPLCLGILGVGATQINSALDALFARFAALEGPAFLWYAIRLQQLPLALFGIALSSSLLPPLARAEKQNNKEQFLNFLFFGVTATIILMSIATFFLFYGAFYLVTWVFARGDFGKNSIEGTYLCLQAYALGLLPSALITVLAPAFYAKGNFRATTFASFGAMLLNLSLNAFFVLVLKLGPASIAFATSLSTWLQCLYLAIQFKKLYLPFFFEKKLTTEV